MAPIFLVVILMNIAESDNQQLTIMHYNFFLMKFSDFSWLDELSPLIVDDILFILSVCLGSKFVHSTPTSFKIENI